MLGGSWVSSASAPLLHLTFQLDWHPNAQFAGLLLAREKGWFEEAGLDVTILPVDPDMKVVERVVEGTNWLGCSESGVLVAARSKGIPIKAIGTMLQANPMALLSLGPDGHRNLESLLGKTIGVHPDGQRALDLVLANDGFRRDQFNIIEKEHDLSALLAGQCAAVQGYLIDEAVDLENQGRSVTAIPYFEHGYAAYSQVYFANESFIRSNPQALRKFLQVARAGWQAALLNPDETARMIVTRYASGLNQEYQRRSLQSIARLSTLESGFGRLGTMSSATWSNVLVTFQKLEVLTRPVTVEEMTDFSLVNPKTTLPDLHLLPRNFQEPGGQYPSITIRDLGLNAAQGLLNPLEMVAVVDPSGRAVAVMMVEPGRGKREQQAAILHVTERWQWPRGTWRRFRIQVPVENAQ